MDIFNEKLEKYYQGHFLYTQNVFYKMLMNVYLCIKECQVNDSHGASMGNVNFGWLKFLFFCLIESSIRFN